MSFALLLIISDGIMSCKGLLSSTFSDFELITTYLTPHTFPSLPLM